MRHDRAYLLDMLLAAHEAKEFAADLTLPELEQNRMVQFAILKTVEIIVKPHPV